MRAQHCERVAQVVDGLNLRRACRRVARRQLPLDERVLIEPGFGLVHRQQFRARRGLLRPALLKEPHHLRVQRNAVTRPERCVGGVAHQGVLERVSVAAVRAHQPRVDERSETFAECGGVERSGARVEQGRQQRRAKTRDRGRRRPERRAWRRRGRQGAPSTDHAAMPARPPTRRDRRRGGCAPSSKRHAGRLLEKERDAVAA